MGAARAASPPNAPAIEANAFSTLLIGSSSAARAAISLAHSNTEEASSSFPAPKVAWGLPSPDASGSSFRPCTDATARVVLAPAKAGAAERLLDLSSSAFLANRSSKPPQGGACPNLTRRVNASSVVARCWGWIAAASSAARRPFHVIVRPVARRSWPEPSESASCWQTHACVKQLRWHHAKDNLSIEAGFPRKYFNAHNNSNNQSFRQKKMLYRREFSPK